MEITTKLVSFITKKHTGILRIIPPDTQSTSWSEYKPPTIKAAPTPKEIKDLTKTNFTVSQAMLYSKGPLVIFFKSVT